VSNTITQLGELQTNAVPVVGRLVDNSSYTFILTNPTGLNCVFYQVENQTADPVEISVNVRRAPSGTVINTRTVEIPALSTATVYMPIFRLPTSPLRARVQTEGEIVVLGAGVCKAKPGLLLESALYTQATALTGGSSPSTSAPETVYLGGDAMDTDAPNGFALSMPNTMGRVNVSEDFADVLVDVRLELAGTTENVVLTAYLDQIRADGSVIASSAALVAPVPNNNFEVGVYMGGRLRFNLPVALGDSMYMRFRFQYTSEDPSAINYTYVQAVRMLVDTAAQSSYFALLPFEA
jgi:hypothetical protein